MLKTQTHIAGDAFDLSCSVLTTSPKSLLARVDSLIGLLPNALDLQAISDRFPARQDVFSTASKTCRSENTSARFSNSYYFCWALPLYNLLLLLSGTAFLDAYNSFLSSCSYENSLNTVLRLEALRYNDLLDRISSSLELLRRALRGEIIMSFDIESTFEYVANRQVPEKWKEVSLL